MTGQDKAATELAGQFEDAWRKVEPYWQDDDGAYFKEHGVDETVSILYGVAQAAQEFDLRLHRCECAIRSLRDALYRL